MLTHNKRNSGEEILKRRSHVYLQPRYGGTVPPLSGHQNQLFAVDVHPRAADFLSCRSFVCKTMHMLLGRAAVLCTRRTGPYWTRLQVVRIMSSGIVSVLIIIPARCRA